jgi:hypothetical protein
MIARFYSYSMFAWNRSGQPHCTRNISHYIHCFFMLTPIMDYPISNRLGSTTAYNHQTEVLHHNISILFTVNKV